MKTETKEKKTFDAVEFMRRRRDKISKDVEGMTPKEEIEYFNKKALNSINKTSEIGSAHNWLATSRRGSALGTVVVLYLFYHMERA